MRLLTASAYLDSIILIFPQRSLARFGFVECQDPVLKIGAVAGIDDLLGIIVLRLDKTEAP
jgi:hypothetical protein